MDGNSPNYFDLRLAEFMDKKTSKHREAMHIDLDFLELPFKVTFNQFSILMFIKVKWSFSK